MCHCFVIIIDTVAKDDRRGGRGSMQVCPLPFFVPLLNSSLSLCPSPFTLSPSSPPPFLPSPLPLLTLSPSPPPLLPSPLSSLIPSLILLFCQLGQGLVFDSERNILLEEVPIITPNKDIVVASLSFEVYNIPTPELSLFLSPYLLSSL